MAKRKPPDQIVQDCARRLSFLGPIRTRAMFGGHGVYCEDLFFALIAEGVLYFKADDKNRAMFEAAGGKAFTYMGKHRPMTMSYYNCPDEGSDAAARFDQFARAGLDAARRKAGKTVSDHV